MDPFTSAEEFRRLLYAVSYPGEVVTLGTSRPYLSILNKDTKFYTDREEEKEFIERYTGAVFANIEDADYLILHKEPDRDTMISMKRGDIEFPEESATIFLKISKIGEGTKILIRGPGVRDYKVVSLTLSKRFFEVLQEINDFPVGLDVFIMDKSRRLIAIPRSVEVTVWDS